LIQIKVRLCVCFRQIWLRIDPETTAKLEGKRMKNLSIFACTAVLAGTLSAWGADTGPASGKATRSTEHTKEHMTAGTHTMPENKQMHMSNKAMPSHNPRCFSAEALAKMPAEHRAACGKKD